MPRRKTSTKRRGQRLKGQKVSKKVEKFSKKPQVNSFFALINKTPLLKLVGLLIITIIIGSFFLGQLVEHEKLQPKLTQAELELNRAKEEIASKSSEIDKLSGSLTQSKEEYKTLESISKAQEAYAKRLEKISGSLANIAIKQESLIKLGRQITVLFVEAKQCIDAYNFACSDMKLNELDSKLKQANSLESEITTLLGNIQADSDFLRKAGLL